MPVAPETLDDLIAYLRGFTNLHGDPVPYDVVAVAHLLGALVDNLDAHGLDADFEDAIPEALGPQGVARLERLVDRLRAARGR
jgi:hypothetical protein